MNKPRKDEIVVGLVLASNRYKEVMVLGWFKKSRGLVKVQSLDATTFGREVVLPMQSLRWQ